MRRDRAALERRWLLEQGLTEAEVARRLRVHRQSVNRWAKALKVEDRSGYWKHHALPNFCPDDLTELGYFGRLALRRCAAGRRWYNPFGSRRICRSNIQSSIGPRTKRSRRVAA